MKEHSVLSEEILRNLEEAVSSIRFGTVQITIHDGRVVQLEKSEKVRFPSHPVEIASAVQKEISPTDRIAGGKR